MNDFFNYSQALAPAIADASISREEAEEKTSKSKDITDAITVPLTTEFAKESLGPLLKKGVSKVVEKVKGKIGDIVEDVSADFSEGGIVQVRDGIVGRTARSLRNLRNRGEPTARGDTDDIAPSNIESGEISFSDPFETDLTQGISPHESLLRRLTNRQTQDTGVSGDRPDYDTDFSNTRSGTSLTRRTTTQTDDMFSENPFGTASTDIRTARYVRPRVLVRNQPQQEQNQLASRDAPEEATPTEHDTGLSESDSGLGRVHDETPSVEPADDGGISAVSEGAETGVEQTGSLGSDLVEAGAETSALDETGIGAVVSGLLMVGGIFASVFGHKEATPSVSMNPSQSFGAGI